MKTRMFKGVCVQSGTKMMEFLEANNTKAAEKLLKCLNRMSDACYDAAVVAQTRKDNPDLF